MEGETPKLHRRRLPAKDDSRPTINGRKLVSNGDTMLRAVLWIFLVHHLLQTLHFVRNIGQLESVTDSFFVLCISLSLTVPIIIGVGSRVTVYYLLYSEAATLAFLVISFIYNSGCLSIILGYCLQMIKYLVFDLWTADEDEFTLIPPRVIFFQFLLCIMVTIFAEVNSGSLSLPKKFFATMYNLGVAVHREVYSPKGLSYRIKEYNEVSGKDEVLVTTTKLIK